MSLHLILEEDLVHQVQTAQRHLKTLVDLAEPRAVPEQPEHITFEADALWASLSHINELLLGFTDGARTAPVANRAHMLEEHQPHPRVNPHGERQLANNNPQGEAPCKTN